MNIAINVEHSNYTGLIDRNFESHEEYQPKLLVNDAKKGQKILSNIISELKNCEEFYFSVAFITNSGITSIINILDELKEKKIKGKILTSQYQNFTEPIALKRLIKFHNIDLRIMTEGNMHAKGYLFKKKEYYTLIVGSSNLTQSALSINNEWNLKVTTMEDGFLKYDTLREFEYNFNNATVVNIEWIEQYNKIYTVNQKNIKDNKSEIISLDKIYPNKMQIDALASLDNLRMQGKYRAILISATGTGKTYLSAFDISKYKPNKILFLAHREQLLSQALLSFKRVLGDEKSYGLLSGNIQETGVDYLFSTVQMMSKDNVYNQFEYDYFQYIIIDEVHRAGAESYHKILDYFKPKFLLGMTATPERLDGFDIFKLFNNNIAYEIRLQQALEEDLLCPFHYFGVSEITVDGIELDDKTEFKYLVAEQRIKHIIDKIEFYGYSGIRVKGLIFCSDKKEARELSNGFNQYGYNTVALTSENTPKEREEAIERLEQDEDLNKLDYIFSVDIFAEGVDIPAVNQIVMLRPTKSPIIFIQQLGRGLRKNKDKEYVVVIDFIGNYTNNFLIPIALSGDRTYNKDTIRRYVMEGSRIIPGCSTVNFDSISKKRIFASIDKANFNDIKIIKESYYNLKNKLGKIPNLMDFYKLGSIDATRIFDNNSLGSYHVFLKKYEKDYEVKLNHLQEEVIEFISKKIVMSKRIHELEFLKFLIQNNITTMELFGNTLKEKYNLDIREKTKISVTNILMNKFPAGTGKDTYRNSVLIEEEGSNFVISKSFSSMLLDINFKNMVLELLEFGLERVKIIYGERYLDTNFQLYQKYTYEDVCRLLDWPNNIVAQNIGGYKYDEKTNTFPVFINYEKDEGINDSIKYEDRFISPNLLIALSKQPRTVNSKDIMQIYNAEKNGTELYLFVRKNKDDNISKEFYFLGRIKAIGSANPVTIKNTNKKAVEITYQLQTPVRQDIYDYITSK